MIGILTVENEHVRESSTLSWWNYRKADWTMYQHLYGSLGDIKKKKKKDSENHSRDVNANIDTFGEMVGEKRLIEMSERKTAE